MLSARSARELLGAVNSLEWAVFTVPALGGQGYELRQIQTTASPEPVNREKENSAPNQNKPLHEEWVHNKDVLKVCAGYMDVFSLARVRGVCREFYQDFRPLEFHVPHFATNIESCIDAVHEQQSPCVAIAAVAGRTASSQRFIIMKFSAPSNNPMEKIYFTASSASVVREIKAIVEGAAPATDVLELPIENLSLETAKGKVVRAAFSDHPLDGFWDWCHPTVQGRYRPTLSIC